MVYSRIIGDAESIPSGMSEDWSLLVSFLPGNWRDLAAATGALKGLRKDKSAESLLRVLLVHLGCGHSLQETAVRARKAHLAELPELAVVASAEEVAGLVASPVRGAIPGAGRGVVSGREFQCSFSIRIRNDSATRAVGSGGDILRGPKGDGNRPGDKL